MSLTLKNITFGEFLNLTDDEAYPYIFAFRHGRTLIKPINHYNLKPLIEFSFGRVKDGMYLLEKGVTMADVPMFLSIYHWRDESFWLNVGVVEVLQFFAYVKKELETLMEVERKRLVRALSSKEIMAGIEKFSEFGYLPQAKVLAQLNFQSTDWVLKQPYGQMLNELCLNAVENDYQIAYSRLK